MEKMTTDSHCIGSKKSHSRGEEDAKESGIWKQMKDEEYDREKDEIRTHLSLLMELLQRSKEYQRCGWIMTKKLKWHRLQVKREHRLNAQGKEGLLRATECQEEFLVCELKQDPIFDESDEDTGKRSIEDILNHMKDLQQQEELQTEVSSETIRSYDFKSDNLCMIAGLTGDRQSSKTVLKMKESCEVKYDDECILDEERFELMQQKELIDSLLN